MSFLNDELVRHELNERVRNARHHAQQAELRRQHDAMTLPELAAGPRWPGVGRLVGQLRRAIAVTRSDGVALCRAAVSGDCVPSGVGGTAGRSIIRVHGYKRRIV